MANLVVEGINIAQLSDEELSRRLKSLGSPYGPIVATTRKVYERMLARILRNEVVEEDYVDEETPYNENIKPFDIPKQPRWTEELRRRPLNRSYGNWGSTPSPHRGNRVDVISRMVDQEVPRHPDRQSSMSIPTKLIIIIVSIIIVFLVYHNMECGNGNPIPVDLDT